MAPLLALFAFPFVQGGPDLPPIEMEDFEGEPGILAKVDGKPHHFVLATRWPTSYLLGAKGVPKSVVIGTTVLADLPLRTIAKASMFPKAEGVLGADALRKACFAIDPLYQRMEILAHPKIGLEGAKAYFAKLPVWEGAPKVVKIPLGRTIAGVPTVATTIGGQKALLTLSFSTYNSTLGPTIKKPKSAGMADWSYLPNVVFPGLAARWMSYGAYDKWDVVEEGSHGIVALDAFLSRRIIVDLADNAAYVEELPETARISFFLSNRARLPLVVSGDGATFGPLPGIYMEDAVGPMNGYKVKSIAEIPIEDWLKDFRSGTPEATARLGKRFALLSDDFDVTVIGPDGKEETVPVPRRGGPEDMLRS